MKSISAIIVFLIIVISCRSSARKEKDDRELYIYYQNRNITDSYARDMLNDGLKLIDEGEYNKAKSFIIRADSAFPNSPIIITAMGNLSGM